DACQRDRESLLTPNRNPTGLTFCPINLISSLNARHPERKCQSGSDRGIPPRNLKANFPGILRFRYAPLRMTVHCYFFPFFARFGFSAFASAAPPSVFASPPFFFAAFCAAFRVS